MHLKDDNKTLLGFFTVGLLFALATFVAMSFLFNVNSTKNRLIASSDNHSGSISTSVKNPDLVQESAGFSFPAAPENQSYRIIAPEAKKTDYSFSLDKSNSQASIGAAGKGNTTTGSSQSFDWQDLGKKTFNNCSSCHQANGNGIPGAFPPLNKNAALKYNADRDYLLKAVVFGLNGEIEVDGNKYNGAMPAWAQLSDEEIAAVLNHELSSWDNPGIIKAFQPYLPADVARIRSLNLSSSDTLEQRP